MRFARLTVDQEPIRLFFVLIGHDPDGQQHRLAGKPRQQCVHFYIATAARDITLINGLAFQLLHRLSGVRAGILSRHVKLFNDGVVQVNLCWRYSRIEVKRT